MPDSVQLTLVVKPGESDADELDQATRGLLTELQDLPLESVSLAPAGDLPPGAKAGDAITLGALSLSLAPVVVPALVEFLKSWLARREGRSVVIRKRRGGTATEIEIKSPMSESAIAALIKQLSPKKES
jgi:hypothetical protein